MVLQKIPAPVAYGPALAVIVTELALAYADHDAEAARLVSAGAPIAAGLAGAAIAYAHQSGRKTRLGMDPKTARWVAIAAAVAAAVIGLVRLGDVFEYFSGDAAKPRPGFSVAVRRALAYGSIALLIFAAYATAGAAGWTEKLALFGE
jgi:hypothetical protein